jgi:outer membrane protein assembly factor BamB
MSADPTPRWKTDAFASPKLCAITDDRLYLVADGTLHAVGKATGECEWKTGISPGARIHTTDAAVFVRRPNESTLRCLAAPDGAELWETELSGSFTYLLANESNAIVPAQTADGQGLLEAVDIYSGDEDWSWKFEAPVSAITPVSNGIVLIDADQRVSLVDEQGGIERWSNDIDDHIYTHVAHDGRLCIGHESGLTIIDMQTAIPKPRIGEGHGVRTIEPIDGGITVGSTDGTITHIEWESGANWSTAFSDPITALSADDGMLYVGNRSGIVAGLDAATGATAWETSVAGAVQDLLIHQSSLFARVSDGSTSSFESASGEHRWRLTVNGSSLSPRIETHGDDMYLHTPSALLSVDSKEGSINWKYQIDKVLFGDDCICVVQDGTVISLPLLPDATTQFMGDRDEDDDSITRIWRGD